MFHRGQINRIWKFGNPKLSKTVLDMGIKPTVLIAEEGLIIAKDDEESRLKIYQGEHVWEIKKQGHNVVEVHATDVMIVVFYVNKTEDEEEDLYGTMGVWCRDRRVRIDEKHIGVPHAFECSGATILIQDEGGSRLNMYKLEENRVVKHFAKCMKPKSYGMMHITGDYLLVCLVFEKMEIWKLNRDGAAVTKSFNHWNLDVKTAFYVPPYVIALDVSDEDEDIDVVKIIDPVCGQTVKVLKWDLGRIPNCPKLRNIALSRNGDKLLATFCSKFCNRVEVYNIDELYQAIDNDDDFDFNDNRYQRDEEIVDEVQAQIPISEEDESDGEELEPNLEMKYRQIMAKRNGGRVFDFGPVDEQLKDYWNSLSYISINSIVKVVDLPETKQVKVMTLEF